MLVFRALDGFLVLGVELVVSDLVSLSNAGITRHNATTFNMTGIGVFLSGKGCGGDEEEGE